MSTGAVLILIAAGVAAYFVGRRIDVTLQDFAARIPPPIMFGAFALLLVGAFLLSGGLSWRRFALLVGIPIGVGAVGWWWSRRLTRSLRLPNLRGEAGGAHDLGPNEHIVEEFLRRVELLSRRDWHLVTERARSSEAPPVLSVPWLRHLLASRAVRKAGRPNARRAAAWAVRDVVAKVRAIGTDTDDVVDLDRLLIEAAAATAAEALVVSDRLKRAPLQHLYRPFESSIPLRTLPLPTRAPEIPERSSK